VVIVNSPKPASVIPLFKPTCANSATISIPLNAKETITFNSVGLAKIQPLTSPKDSYLLSDLQDFPKVNKFNYTLRLGTCTIKDTLKYSVANKIISIVDTIKGLAGDTIKVILSRVAKNDTFAIGDTFDSLIVQGINSSNSSIIVSKFQKNDTSFYFVTNKKIVKKEAYSYRLRNKCGVLSNVATLVISARNSPPRTLSQEFELGDKKILKFSYPIIQLDSNRYLKSIIPFNLPLGVSANHEYDTVSNIVTFTIDITNAQIINARQTVQFRICDDSVCNEIEFILLPKISQDIEVYNALSPNGDGKHDFLEIKNIELAKENTLNIFNRWGDKVYSATNYDNVKEVFDGGNLPDGTYYYVFEPKGDKKILEGFILLKR
jgi:gliding motility-associated-like protein